MKHRTFVVIALVAFCLPLLASAAGPVAGRYVHVTIPGPGHTLSLAEVQVFSGGKNVALKCKTVQNSTASAGVSSRAVDGRTDGEWSRGSITHTVEGMTAPCWEVDLGAARSIEKISLWNRDGFESRLNGFEVYILDSRRKVVWAGGQKRAAKGESAFTVGASRSAMMGKAMAKVKASKVTASRRKARKPAAPAIPAGSYGTAKSLKLAIEDLIKTYGSKYPKGRSYLARLAALEPKLNAGEGKAEFDALQREALLTNPILDFDKILLVQRKGVGKGLPANWQGNSSTGKTGYDNFLGVLSPLDKGKITELHRPADTGFVGDFDLHFDADKICFSSVGKNKAWAVMEVKIDGSGLRQVSPDEHADVDNYDPVYLPDGRIIFDSTSGYQGVPCVSGNDFVANLHIMDANGKNIRRLCFEQDNDWYPVMLPNGRVMYLRWEYTDSAHYFSRVLMHMNPDGTDQKEYYGSNSYWPNSLFYAKPIPGSNTKFVGIVTGHHGVRRIGEMVVFDAARGRHEADGALQLIGKHGEKVVAKTIDRLVDGSWPKFLHPHPLSEKYYLASAQLNSRASWGVYLVDIYDNMVLLKDVPGYSLYEPVPLKKTAKPRIIPDRIDPTRKDAVVFMTDVYEGKGLAGVPRGSVKNLRIYRYEYSLRKTGGHYNIGMEGPWDTHIILGTVPVDPDGSAMFRIPANTPISIQPLDAEGKALQLMRSWTVGMPGENLACQGCHEPQNAAVPARRMATAFRKPVADIKPWRGPARGFSFLREVQPVLDKYCIGCHDGGVRKDGKAIPNFADTTGKTFPKSYMALHPYCRRNGPEGDYHLLTPLEFHVDTSELVQLLQKGHNNVQLDAEAWDRIITWIDLNVPALGTWTERGANPEYIKRRKELRKIYVGIYEDPEVILNPYERTEKFIKPKALPKPPAVPAIAGWPFDAGLAKAKQGANSSTEIDCGASMKMKLVRIPAGQFAMGSNTESPQERPVAAVKIDKGFRMGATEVTLAQFQQFDPKHVNGIYDKHYKDQVNRGYVMDRADFPVIRVTWTQAMAYCKWLSAKTGKRVTLPTEAQWEWACRSGTDSPLSFGGLDTEFSTLANMADIKMKELAVKGVNPQPIKNPPPDLDFEPKDIRSNDGVLHLAKVGSYTPNAWGLHDMHGNVAEWTRSAPMAYPYRADDGRNDASRSGKRIVRGGGWHDRQYRCTSAYRLSFPDWQKVYNVGFRVVIEDGPIASTKTKTATLTASVK